jgi:hypothetical protein
MNTKTIRITLIVLVIIAGIYGITNHQEHLAPYLPFTFLLGCLVMHLLMHSGHHGHGHDHNDMKKHE